MGQFLERLFFVAVKIFQTIGEVTIFVLNLGYRLIVWVIRLSLTACKSLLLGIGSLAIGLGGIGRALTASMANLGKRVSTISLPKLRFPKISLSLKPLKFKRKRGRPRKAKSLKRKIAWFSLGFAIASILIAAPVLYFYTRQQLPNPRMLTLRSIPVTTKIYDRNGVLLYELYADQDRTPVPLDEIPVAFKNATIAIEDKNFYQHQGFSVEGITRAAYATFVQNNLQGGSTITQQLVRSALLNRELTLTRKLKELALSIWSEQIYSKDEILEMYFNQVPYGGTAWGAEAASQLYFGKSIRDLSLAESALLAGLPAAPTTFSPFGSRPELALQRQKEVLRRMEEDGYISSDERIAAENDPIRYTSPNTSIKAPHFVMYVRDLLAKKYGMRAVEQGGLRVTTSLDLSIQEQAQALVKQEVEKLAGLYVGNGAAVVTDPNTGEIIAMIGSTDYFDIEREGNVNVALTQQQPGSTIKVVTYAAALQSGMTAASLLNDSPITYTIPGSTPYSPVNYDGRFHGYVPVRTALGNSYNIPAVRALAKIGVPAMVSEGKKMGIQSWEESGHFGLSLTLGGGEVTMLDMASVYNTLANEGVYQELTPILTVTDYLGNTLEDNRNKKGVQAISEEVAFIISDILADNNARLASFGPRSKLYIPDQWVAVKTGTSEEKRDNWTNGYTKDFAVTAWVGNNDNSPMHPTLTSGVTGATDIWRVVTDLMLTYYPESTPPTPPAGVVTAKCRGIDEYFIRGTEKGACQPIPTPLPSQAPEENGETV